MTFPKIAKGLAAAILILGIIAASMVYLDSLTLSIIYVVTSLLACVIIYGLGEIVEVLYRINDKQN